VVVRNWLFSKETSAAADSIVWLRLLACVVLAAALSPHESLFLKVREDLRAKLIDQTNDLLLQILAHLLQQEHVLSVEEAHQARPEQLLISHEVVSGEDADIAVKGEEKEEQDSPVKALEQVQVSAI
jgi:hypothetical protein